MTSTDSLAKQENQQSLKDKTLPSLPQQRAYRSAYERLILPVGMFITKFGISANQVSYLGVFFAALSAVAYYYARNDQFWFIYLGILFMLLSTFMDVVDGSVARAYIAKGGPAGKYGKLLDPAMDRYAEAFFLLGILVSGYVPVEWVFFCFVGMIMASYVRARAESLGPGPDGKPLFISVGIERKEKLSFLGFFSGLEALVIQLKLITNQTFWPYFSWGTVRIGPMAWGVVIVGILSHIAAFQRLSLAEKYLNYQLPKE